METLTPEEKIACADHLLETMFEQVTDGVFIIQPDGKIAHANKRAVDFLGFSQEDLLTFTYSTILSDAHKSDCSDRMSAFFRDGKGFERYECEFITKNNHIVFVEVLAFAVLLKGIPAQLILFRDVCDRKDREAKSEKIFAWHKELASIIDRSFEAIVITDAQGIIQYVNASWERLNGWTSAEVVGKVTPRIIKSGVQSGAFYEEFWKTLLTGATVERSVTNKQKDGTVYEADIIVMPLKSDQGVITGFAGFQHDVTAWKQAQVQLLQEKKFSEDIIERANAIVIVIDAKGIVVRFNQKAEEITGYTKKEIIGKDLFETIFPRAKYPLLWSEFTYTSGEEGLTKMFENSIITKGGDERIFAWSVSEIAKDEKTIAIISFGSDITEQKKTESDLIERNKELERFKDLMVGRELKMIELKKEIDLLKHANTPHAEKDIT